MKSHPYCEHNFLLGNFSKPPRDFCVFIYLLAAAGAVKSLFQAGLLRVLKDEDRSSYCNAGGSPSIPVE